MISIIIPVYNGEKFIKRSIESVIKQRGSWELIVVNDHSTDQTHEILSGLLSDRYRLKVIDSPSKGVTDARMAGVEIAEGDYLFFMDADDEMPLGVIEKMESIIHADSSIDIVISDITDVKGSEVCHHPYGDESITFGWQLFNWITDNRTGFLWGKAIKKSLFMSLEYVPHELKFCEDYIQMLQVSLKAKRVAHIGTSGYIYYQNPDSACNTVKSRVEYANQFYKFSVALRRLIDISIYKEENPHSDFRPITRLKVMILYYLRLYLVVIGGWMGDKENMQQSYRLWMGDNAVCMDPLYDRRRRIQTIIAYYFPLVVASLYVPVLKYKHHRIK